MVVVWKKSARKRVFSKRKVEQANGARAFGTTTNIRRMAREGRKEIMKESSLDLGICLFTLVQFKATL
jgi:hypothetical protein